MKTDTKPRDMRLDALRGYFLILMAAVHVPTPVSHALQDPLGYNGAAEGFVFLSACLAGWVYGRAYQQTDWPTMFSRIWNRVKQIYRVHLAVLLPTVLIAWVLSAKVPTLANHFTDFLVHPWGSLALMPLLLHQPPLFDILPLYVIFLAVTPWLLACARCHGWKILLAVSFLGWLAAQFKLDTRLVGDPARLLPLRWGSFDLLAWQFLWICGVAIGETSLRRQIIRNGFRFILGIPASLIVLFGLLSRHGLWPQTWWNDNLFLYMDKWTLGPLRILNFGAWFVLLLIWNPHLPRWLLAPTALLGRHSLAVFSFHLPLVIIATVLIQSFAFSNTAQIVTGLLVIALLFPWAACLEYKRWRNAGSAKTLSPPVRASGETVRA